MSDICSVCDNKSDSIDWICCEDCNDWYHTDCIKLNLNLNSTDIKKLKHFTCLNCSKKKNENTSVRKSNRVKKRIDYVALNNQSIIREINKHPHIESFKSFKNDRPLDKLVYLVDTNVDKNEKGLFTDKILSDILYKTSFKKPILIKGANPNITETYNEKVKINFQIPNFDINKISNIIGFKKKLPVMDVMSQNNLNNWNMLNWLNYFNSLDRKQIFNVISLEISSTNLSNFIKLPKIVKNLDIVLKLKNLNKYDKKLNLKIPKIQKYLLMSVKNCFTDFHIDFGGTSVYYSIVKGRKKFLLFPPTARNLKAYENWCLSENQNKVWFPSLIKKLSPGDSKKIKYDAYINNGMVIEIEMGDLLLLPSGWIHAVLTEEDSIIIGGNFLNILSLESHLKIHQIELNTHINEKFKYPNFIKFVWLIGYYLMLKNLNLSNSEITSVGCLLDFYINQLNSIKNLNNKKLSKADEKVFRKIKNSIPVNIIGDIDKYILDFTTWLNEKKKFNEYRENENGKENGVNRETGTETETETEIDTENENENEHENENRINFNNDDNEPSLKKQKN